MRAALLTMLALPFAWLLGNDYCQVVAEILILGYFSWIAFRQAGYRAISCPCAGSVMTSGSESGRVVILGRQCANTALHERFACCREIAGFQTFGSWRSEKSVSGRIQVPWPRPFERQGLLYVTDFIMPTVWPRACHLAYHFHGETW